MGGKSGSGITGYKYFMGLHFALCYGPVDALIKIIVGDRVAWGGAPLEGGASVTVRAATTTAGTLSSSFQNNAILDGLTLATGDRILVKNQFPASDNGVYVVAASGAPTRSTDADSGAELLNINVKVTAGSVNSGSLWECSAIGPITVGTTDLDFVQTDGIGEAAVTANQTIYINQPALFGGDEKEGGIQGNGGVLMGGPSQVANPYLAEKIGTDIPAFRGVTSFVYNGGQVAANNPYIKPWGFQVKRITKGWNAAGDAGSTVTDRRTSVLFPWFQGHDPRACLNDHEYEREPGGGGPGGWHSSIDDAISDAVAAGFDPAQFAVYLGWSKVSDWDLDVVSPSVIPGETEILRLHFNSMQPPSFSAGTSDPPGTPTACAHATAAGITRNGPRIWIKGTDNGHSPGIFRLKDWPGGAPSYDPGEVTVNNCTDYMPSDLHYPILSYIPDGIIYVRRAIRAPDDPCFPRCSDPFPSDPNDDNYCLIGGSPVYAGGYSLQTGTFKVLQKYATFSGGSISAVSNSTLVTKYPVGPILPSTDPSYSDSSYWTAAYNAAVLAGLMAPGLIYGTDYPVSATSAYVRTTPTLSTDAGWYPEKADINGDMNPAHIVYQCLTDPVWGMGYPTGAIDDTNFRAVADTLFSETFGLSFMWTQQSTISEFVTQVMNHIGGVLYVNPSTGEFSLKLIRDDYDPDSLPIFDESNIVSLDSFQRVGYGDTVNEITVVYNDRATNAGTPITVQDLANIQAQGAVVSQQTQYPGISNADLAARVAMRDLTSISTPLAKATIKVNRSAWSNIPGDVVKLSWAALGFTGVIFRVLQINYGDLNDGTISVDMAEDVFGLPDSSYARQEPPGWTEPDTSPAKILHEQIVEAPYWNLARTLSTADLAYLDADAAYFLSLAAAPNPVSLNHKLYASSDGITYANVGSGPLAPYATLASAISKADTAITYENDVNMSGVSVGGLLLLGDSSTGEFVKVLAHSPYYKTMTLARGILDTTPQDHAIGEALFSTDNVFGKDATERATGEVVDYKLTSVTTTGESSVVLATNIEVTANQRQFRPYPPGNFLINGESYPSSVPDSVSVSWAHRDRLLQTAYLVEQSEANIGPEPGTTYSAYAYDNDLGDLLDRSIGMTGASWTTTPIGSYSLRVELAAVRDGVECWQRQIHVFSYIGPPGRVSESDDQRFTEFSRPRDQE